MRLVIFKIIHPVFGEQYVAQLQNPIMVFETVYEYCPPLQTIIDDINKLTNNKWDIPSDVDHVFIHTTRQ